MWYDDSPGGRSERVRRALIDAVAAENREMLEMLADYDAFAPWRPRPAEQLELPLVWA